MAFIARSGALPEDGQVNARRISRKAEWPAFRSHAQWGDKVSPKRFGDMADHSKEISMNPHNWSHVGTKTKRVRGRMKIAFVFVFQCTRCGAVAEGDDPETSCPKNETPACEAGESINTTSSTTDSPPALTEEKPFCVTPGGSTS